MSKVEPSAAEQDALLPTDPNNDSPSVFAGLMSAYVQQRWVLLILGVTSIGQALALILLVLVYIKKPVLLFVQDRVGNLVQLDPRSMVSSGRDQMEVKGFAIRFIRDAFQFNPGNVNDMARYALRFVEPAAHPAAKNAMKLNERAEQAQNGFSIKVDDDIDKGRVPQVIVNSWEPIQVTVVFGRMQIQPDGTEKPLAPLAVTLDLRQVPRSSTNPSGFLINQITVSTPS